jgi:HEAT repeat protein
MKNRVVSNLNILFLPVSLTFLLLATSGCRRPSIVDYNPPEINIADLVDQARDIVVEALTDEDPAIRSGAIEVVSDTGLTILMPKVQRLLKDESMPVRFAAAVAVGDLHYSLAEGSVKSILNDRDENVRIAAAYALNRLGYPENFEILRKAIASNDQTVRANAAWLLGKSADPNVLKFLYWIMQRNDSSDKVRFQAAEAIAALGDDQIYPKLWTMLISTYADDRLSGVIAMGALGSGPARNALITMLNDDVPEIRLAAAEQLGELGGTTGEPQVLDVFRKNLVFGLDDEDAQRLYARTALAIGRIATPNLTRFLPQLLKNESKLVRINAARAVLRAAGNI